MRRVYVRRSGLENLSSGDKKWEPCSSRGSSLAVTSNQPRELLAEVQDHAVGVADLRREFLIDEESRAVSVDVSTGDPVEHRTVLVHPVQIGESRQHQRLGDESVDAV